jgi:hypothetical protein
MFAVHEPKGFTGCFRLQRIPCGNLRLQCEVLWSVTRDRCEVKTYRTWRDAAESDLIEAFWQANDNDRQREAV